jgi:hypothetical protein
MNAALDPVDPLNMHDLEPPREQAVALLQNKVSPAPRARNLLSLEEVGKGG